MGSHGGKARRAEVTLSCRIQMDLRGEGVAAMIAAIVSRAY